MNLNIFVSDQDSSLSNYSYDTELGGMAETPQNCAVFQRFLSRMEKWSGRGLVKFSKGKVLPRFMVRAGCLEAALHRRT